jgi:hypothetical protein
MNNMDLHAATMKYVAVTGGVREGGAEVPVPVFIILIQLQAARDDARAMTGKYELLLVLTMVQVQVHSTHTVLVLPCTWSVGMSKCAINYQP